MNVEVGSLKPELKGRIVDEACRRSLLAFHMRAFAIGHPGQQILMAPYIDAICHQLERIYRGECKRLIVTVPPRHGKSELASVSFPAWALGHDPSLNFMVVSYGLELSRLHAEKARTLVGDPHYRRLFPETQVQRGKDKSHVFGTTAGGEWRAISTGGAVTGLGANIMIIDDLHKADEALTPVGREAAIQFYQNSLLSRFDDPINARIIVVQQRLHEEDIVGWLLERGGWHHLNLPSVAEHDETISLTRGREWHRKKGDLLHPERVPMEYLEQRRLELGNRFYGAQYQQNPIIADGAQIRLSWFDQYDEPPQRAFFHKVVQSWDTASTDRITSDFSVGMTWGYRDGQWYLLDLIRARLEFPDLVPRVMHWHRRWRSDALLIEGASTGHSLYQEVRRAKIPGKLICVTPKGSKLDRLAGRTAQLATGDYLLPASADWLQPLCQELVAFPDARHDDQVDALVQFLEFVFDWDRWVRTEYGLDGRRMRPHPQARRPSRYD